MEANEANELVDVCEANEVVDEATTTDNLLDGRPKINTVSNK